MSSSVAAAPEDDNMALLEKSNNPGVETVDGATDNSGTPEHSKDKGDEMEQSMEVVGGLGKPAYRVYVLALFLFAYLLNQLDRYILSIVTQPMSQDLHYGTKGCIDDVANFTAEQIDGYVCTNITSETSCEQAETSHDLHVCHWNYNGQGFAYEVLVGPVFIVIYTLVGIPLGFWADIYNRKTLFGCAVIFWSVMTGLTGFVNAYWQLVILRFGLGIGEAGCTPFATSLITDYFSPEMRALAIGFYNWGIYIGYSLSYTIGNFVTSANIMGLGWRWTFFIGGLPGLLIGPLILATVREPERQLKRDQQDASDFDSLMGHREVTPTCFEKAKTVCKSFCRPAVLLLCLAGSIRNAAGYIWSYNTQIYYRDLGQTPQEIGTYMSWIPIVGGCLGVVLGGFISDRIVKRVGPYARVFVLCFSQLLAAPFVAGALFFDPPWAYISLIPGYIIGEMWVGVTLAVLVEVIPSPLRTIGVAVYLFIISNIGGNMPLLVPPLKMAFVNLGYNTVQSLRYALYILYPGLYVLSAALFALTIPLLRWDLNRVRRQEYEELG